MKYVVTWQPSAEDKLTRLWMQASDRKAVEQTANRIDQILTHAPETKGQDFYGDWILVVDPLQIVYKVEPNDLSVTVLDVWM